MPTRPGMCPKPHPEFCRAAAPCLLLSRNVLPPTPSHSHLLSRLGWGLACCSLHSFLGACSPGQQTGGELVVPRGTWEEGFRGSWPGSSRVQANPGRSLCILEQHPSWTKLNQALSTGETSLRLAWDQMFMGGFPQLQAGDAARKGLALKDARDAARSVDLTGHHMPEAKAGICMHGAETRPLCFLSW